MPRVKVTPPDQFLFSMERRIGISDVNYAKHLDSIAMVKILHEARLQFLASLGFAEGNIFGLGMVVTDLAVEYRSESFANDMLVIDVGVAALIVTDLTLACRSLTVHWRRWFAMARWVSSFSTSIDIRS